MPTPSNDQTLVAEISVEETTNFWLMALEAAMCGLLIVTSMLTEPSTRQSQAADQVIVEATPQPAEANDAPPGAGSVQPMVPTHRLVALGVNPDATTIVIELDHALPANAAVKFLINKKTVTPEQ